MIAPTFISWQQGNIGKHMHYGIFGLPYFLGTTQGMQQFGMGETWAALRELLECYEQTKGLHVRQD